MEQALAILVSLPIVCGTILSLVAIAAHHRRAMVRLRMDGDVAKQVAALRSDLHSLRDTSMQFDISLDKNLHSLSRRIEELESHSDHRYDFHVDTGEVEQSLRADGQ